MTFFFFFFLWKLFISLFLPPLSPLSPPFSLSLSVSLQGPHAAINFNTWCSNRCSLELCTHTQQAGNKDSPPPSLQPFNLKKKKKNPPPYHIPTKDTPDFKRRIYFSTESLRPNNSNISNLLGQKLPIKCPLVLDEIKRKKTRTRCSPLKAVIWRSNLPRTPSSQSLMIAVHRERISGISV